MCVGHPRIIHRDIKTANILLDCNFEAMVCTKSYNSGESGGTHLLVSQPDSKGVELFNPFFFFRWLECSKSYSTSCSGG